MIHIAGRVRRDVLRALGWRGGFANVCVNRGVFRGKALLQRLVAGCGHVGGGTGGEQSEAEEAGSDLDFH
jgi:hypothetical protein